MVGVDKAFYTKYRVKLSVVEIMTLPLGAKIQFQPSDSKSDSDKEGDQWTNTEQTQVSADWGRRETQTRISSRRPETRAARRGKTETDERLHIAEHYRGNMLVVSTGR